MCGMSFETYKEEFPQDDVPDFGLLLKGFESYALSHDINLDVYKEWFPFFECYCSGSLCIDEQTLIQEYEAEGIQYIESGDEVDE